MSDPENKNTVNGQAEFKAEDEVELAKTPDQPESPDEVVIPELEDQFLAAEQGQPAKEESKSRKTLRKIVRWAAGILIILGLGFITAVFSLYLPAREQLNQARQDLTQAEQEIEDLNSKISTLEGETANQATTIGNLQADIDALQSEQQAEKLQSSLLKARLDVANALLALEQDDLASARLILNGTTTTLQNIKDLLPEGQQEAFEPSQTRLEQVLNELDSDLESEQLAARPDLEVLATQLLKLEDNLFDH
ncbi:MAG: hypothetical protein JW862_08950 [Anaerolineales bacterium]|nr:hypothetical protein [Anaerolineales bacterium]